MKEEIDKMEFRNLDMEQVIRVLIELLAKQEGVVIEYTIEKNTLTSKEYQYGIG